LVSENLQEAWWKILMAYQGGLRKWFAEDWRDVKTGKKCGRSGKKDKGRPYPACRPKLLMSKRLEKLADDMINLTPEESQKLALIVKAKLMPEIAKQQQQGLLQQANNPMMQQMGKRPNMQMQMPNARMAAQQGLLRQ
jgi:hypothetical protein